MTGFYEIKNERQNMTLQFISLKYRISNNVAFEKFVNLLLLSLFTFFCNFRINHYIVIIVLSLASNSFL